MNRGSSLNRPPPNNTRKSISRAKNTKKSISRKPSLNLPMTSSTSSRQPNMNNFLGHFNQPQGVPKRNASRKEKAPPKYRNVGFGRSLNYHNSNHKTPGLFKRASNAYQSYRVRRQDQDFERYKQKLAREIELTQKKHDEFVIKGNTKGVEKARKYLEYLKS